MTFEGMSRREFHVEADDLNAGTAKMADRGRKNYEELGKILSRMTATGYLPTKKELAAEIRKERQWIEMEKGLVECE